MTERANIELRHARPQDAEAFDVALRELNTATRQFLHGWTDDMPFAEYLRRLEQIRRGENLPPNWVPSDFLFAFTRDARIAPPGTVVGRASIRPDPDPLLLRQAGHIGYSVLMPYRRQGIATEILQQALGYVREHLHLNEVILTCDADNATSARIIERAGAIYLTTERFAGLPKAKRRYRLHTGA